MNRIRKINGIYQVLLTPNIRISPDSSLAIGSWEDPSLRNFSIIPFETMRDAMNEAFKYPDIDWYRIILNHEYIYQRLYTDLKKIIKKFNFNVQFIPRLMDPITFKDTVFDRVLIGGDRYNLVHGMNDIISFTIVNPWTSNLHQLAQRILRHREHLYRDDLRIRHKKIINDKIIYLYGQTEFGTLYEIKLVPTLLYQWAEWYKNYGHLKRSYAEKLYIKFLKQQDKMDLEYETLR